MYSSLSRIARTIISRFNRLTFYFPTANFNALYNYVRKRDNGASRIHTRSCALYVVNFPRSGMSRAYVRSIRGFFNLAARRYLPIVTLLSLAPIAGHLYTSGSSLVSGYPDRAEVPRIKRIRLTTLKVLSHPSPSPSSSPRPALVPLSSSSQEGRRLRVLPLCQALAIIFLQSASPSGSRRSWRRIHSENFPAIPPTAVRYARDFAETETNVTAARPR